MCRATIPGELLQELIRLAKLGAEARKAVHAGVSVSCNSSML